MHVESHMYLPDTKSSLLLTGQNNNRKMSPIMLILLTKTTWKLKTPGGILVFRVLVQVWADMAGHSSHHFSHWLALQNFTLSLHSRAVTDWEISTQIDLKLKTIFLPWTPCGHTGTFCELTLTPYCMAAQCRVTTQIYTCCSAAVQRCSCPCCFLVFKGLWGEVETKLGEAMPTESPLFGHIRTF